MKINKYLSIIVLGALALAACSKDYYNEQFEGLEDKVSSITDTKIMDYTLTSADYAEMAANSSDMVSDETLAEALKTAGEKETFASSASASELMPYYLAYTGGKFYTLDNGSAINLTYHYYGDAPELYTAKIASFDMDTEKYKKLWGDDKKFINAVTPKTVDKIVSLVPSKGLSVGDYVAFSYAYASSEPDFSGSVPPVFQPNDKYTSVIKDMELGQSITIKGFIAVDSSQGPILADNSGAVLLYKGQDKYNVGDEVTVTGTVSAYNKGFQIDATSATIEVTGTAATVAHPEPIVLDGAAMDEAIKRTDNAVAQYVEVAGTISVSGNYYNFNVSGAQTASGSVYGITDKHKAELKDGDNVVIYGYFTSISSSKYVNIVVERVESAPETVDTYALYRVDAVGESDDAVATLSKFSGSATMLQPADYKAMEQNNSFAYPDLYINKYLSEKNPYAAPETEAGVIYRKSVDSKIEWDATMYIYDGSKWVAQDYRTEIKDQFLRKDGVWKRYPSMDIWLNPIRNDAYVMKYYQAATDWVWENIDKPMNITTKGKGFVTSYGNNEYYTGCSAYYNNIDIRPGSARGQFGGDSYQGSELVAAGIAYAGDGYDNLTDEQVQELMLKRTQYVLGKVLEKLHPDARPDEGFDNGEGKEKGAIYTIYTAVYRGVNVNDCNTAFIYRCVDKGKFEFVKMEEL